MKYVKVTHTSQIAHIFNGHRKARALAPIQSECHGVSSLDRASCCRGALLLRVLLAQYLLDFLLVVRKRYGRWSWLCCRHAGGG